MTPQDQGERISSREQRIVTSLQERVPREAQDLKALRARALDLPAMLRRHGLMHVLLFLAGKGESDQQLANLLRQGIAAALDERAADPDTTRYAENLAGMELPSYLLHWEAAQESATWLKLLVEARTKTIPAALSTPVGGGEAR